MLIFKLLFPSKRLITPCKEQQQKQFTNISGNNQKSIGQNKISDIYNPHFQHPCNIIRLSASCKLKLVFITENGRWIEHSEKYTCLMSPLNLKVIKCVFFYVVEAVQRFQRTWEHFHRSMCNIIYPWRQSINWQG